MLIDVEELLTHIEITLPLRVAEDTQYTGNRSWTRQAKVLLDEFGKSRYQLDSEYTDSASRTKEFLVDFLWWDRHSQEREQMVLAMESELYNSNPRSSVALHA